MKRIFIRLIFVEFVLFILYIILASILGSDLLGAVQNSFISWNNISDFLSNVVITNLFLFSFLPIATILIFVFSFLEIKRKISHNLRWAIVVSIFLIPPILFFLNNGFAGPSEFLTQIIWAVQIINIPSLILGSWADSQLFQYLFHRPEQFSTDTTQYVVLLILGASFIYGVVMNLLTDFVSKKKFS